MKKRPDFIIDTRARRGLSLSTLYHRRPSRCNGRVAMVLAYIPAIALTITAILSTLSTLSLNK